MDFSALCGTLLLFFWAKLVRFADGVNLITIGPGLYPSNKTLALPRGNILVLGSCQFMHNGTLLSLKAYVSTSDWLGIQLWRPVANPYDIERMRLMYQMDWRPSGTGEKEEITLEDGVSVQSGDRIGFMTLNGSIPISYIVKPELETSTWHTRAQPEKNPNMDPDKTPSGDIHNAALTNARKVPNRGIEKVSDNDYDKRHSRHLINRGDVLDFDEGAFPHVFSMVAVFKAEIARSQQILRHLRTDKSTQMSWDFY